MKLRIITGRAGAGKSKLVLETIAAQRFERPQILLYRSTPPTRRSWISAARWGIPPAVTGRC